VKKIALHTWIVLGLLLSVSVGRAQQTDSPVYRIGPRDLLDIRVFEMPELNLKVRVSENGTISLPPMGEVNVSGQTEVDLARNLKQLLESKYAQRATIDVKVEEFRSHPITVIGAVKQPGNLGFSGRWLLLDALTAAGGVGENHGSVVYVLRRAENGLSDQVAINLSDLVEHADPSVNIPLLANDLINVPSIVEVTVYCLGEVRSPGAVTFKSNEHITLLAALAHAGGLTDRASKMVRIKRADATAGTPEVEVDYKRILAGKDPDIELRQGDVIVIKESFF
jgi:polysaccharide export outer membrane protein